MKSFWKIFLIIFLLLLLIQLVGFVIHPASYEPTTTHGRTSGLHGSQERRHGPSSAVRPNGAP
jgi:hypothetical protein